MNPDDAKLAARYPSISKDLQKSGNATDEAEASALAKRRYPSIAKDGGSSTQRDSAARSSEPAQDKELQKLAKIYPSLATALGEATRTDDEAEHRALAKRRYPSIAKDLGEEQKPGAARAEDAPEHEGEDAEDSAEPLELEAPEGFDGKAPTFVEFRQVAGELGLDAERANRLLELHTRTVQADRDAMVGSWERATVADKEIGGERLEEAINDAKAALSQHGTPEFSNLLDELGLGSHPEVIRLLARVARAGRGSR